MSFDISQWYTTYGPMVLRRCRGMLHDEDLSLEAMQDTFVRILRAKDSLHGDAPSSLLYRTATNVCLNKIRSLKRKPVTPVDDLLFTLANLENQEESTIVRQLLDRIFKKDKESTGTIAVLYYVDGLTLHEVAHTVSMSVSGVRKRLSSLKARVKNLEEFNAK